MGSLQLVIAFTVNDSLGGSSSYCTVLSQVRPVRNWLSYLSGFQSGMENWWQVRPSYNIIASYCKLEIKETLLQKFHKEGG